MSDNASGRPIEILLVDDNPGDVRLTQEALKDGKVCNNVQVADDGEEATAILSSETTVQLPDLILLDLNLPKKSGREVLAEIKADTKIRRIPVVILTSSRAEQDIVQSYDLHANAYVTKPVDLESFMAVMKGLEDFWLSIVQLPGQSKSVGDQLEVT